MVYVLLALLVVDSLLKLVTIPTPALVGGNTAAILALSPTTRGLLSEELPQ